MSIFLASVLAAGDVAGATGVPILAGTLGEAAGGNVVAAREVAGAEGVWASTAGPNSGRASAAKNAAE